MSGESTDPGTEPRAGNSCTKFCDSVTRKKTVDPSSLETKLNRCYGMSDLVCMGIGYMVGTGIFVLTGEIVRYEAGAAGIISYVLAGIAATLSAICFAEFAGMVPVAGSGYVYTYVVVGEIWAFIVGWNIALEYVIGSSSAAKSWSATLDSLVNGSISRGISETVGTFDSPLLSPYPDFIALLIMLVVTVFVCISAKTSSNFNKVMVAFKLVTIGIIVVAGFMHVDIDNWTAPGRGGFAPYGVGGVFTGAATAFYAYVGFDGIAIASEETKNPKRTVPIAILISMGIVTFLYVITSIVLTLMVPYYEVDVGSPFSIAFADLGVTWAQYIVGLGTLFGLASVVLSGLYSLPRLLYAMSNDGLLFRSLGAVNEKTQTPLLPIILTGVLAGLLAFFMDLTVLVELLSIGTLLSFTFVAACIVILRYSPTGGANDGEKLPLTENGDTVPNYATATDTSGSDIPESAFVRYRTRVRLYLTRWRQDNLVLACMCFMFVSMVALLLLLILGYADIRAAAWWAIIVLILSLAGIIAPLVVIGCLEQSPSSASFQVPLVPFLPALSIFCNLGLMLMLEPMTWVRLTIWLVIGLAIYFGYGMRHSKENPNRPKAIEEDS